MISKYIKASRSVCPNRDREPTNAHASKFQPGIRNARTVPDKISNAKFEKYREKAEGLYRQRKKGVRARVSRARAQK